MMIHESCAAQALTNHWHVSVKSPIRCLLRPQDIGSSFWSHFAVKEGHRTARKQALNSAHAISANLGPYPRDFQASADNLGQKQATKPACQSGLLHHQTQNHASRPTYSH